MDGLGNALAILLIWLCSQLRDRLERLPDRDPSQLPLWHRLGRLILAAVVSLAFFAPYVWIASKL